ncbi:SDR family NAD(P)-dependent oxidoreductase [Mesorhizobium sp. L-8-3]|uniref:SDR family NAD(P)-dependent oxidoreductase n=1 Tax=Mesorhizobium sp. L-8-3 TaxID=2744522 RepID=UPI00192635ED|nr:SDR family NAD(P)-dependent oxidoreductase [Mesorhizobium sp. L-8-3]BCH22980.1 3-oxoacyl-ACP reductase [Mesorhizobium sp. L-8-3]
MEPVHIPVTPSFRLDGRRALITGAGRGIGLAAAACLAQAGAHVTLRARTRDEVQAAAAAIRSAGGQADALVIDITDIARVEHALGDAEPYDILVSNAGTNRPGPFVDVGAEDFDAVFALNVRAAFFLAQAVARKILTMGRKGSIIHVSSQLGHVGATNRSVYVASKFAIEGLTKALAVELGPKGIRVNTVAPTFTDTPLTRSYGLDADGLAAVEARIKLGRIGKVEDLMGAILFLASDASALVTGTSLVVDGGWTAD